MHRKLVDVPSGYPPRAALYPRISGREFAEFTDTLSGWPIAGRAFSTELASECAAYPFSRVKDTLTRDYNISQLACIRKA